MRIIVFMTVGFFCLSSCQSSSFRPTKRTVEQITSQIERDTSRAGMEAITYDLCDCLDKIDFRRLFSSLKRSPTLARLAKKEILEQEEQEIYNVSLCVGLMYSDQYLGYAPTDAALDSLKAVAGDVCPASADNFTELLSLMLNQGG